MAIISAGRDPARALATEIAETVDTAARGRVIVLGSLPPEGRDLDLLARSPERGRIERSLLAAGLAGGRDRFALFKGFGAYGVELFAAEGYLAGEALDDLFTQALAISGFDCLARPAPAHALLILARIVAGEHELRPKRRARLERILAEDPRAWDEARAQAPAWGAERALALLTRLAGPEWPPLGAQLHLAARRAPLRRRRRRVLVALSGIDGAGKSSQARWLADALTALGVPAQVVWNHSHGTRVLDLMAALPKALLALAGRRRDAMASFDQPSPGSGGGAAPPTSVARAVWAMLVTTANALELRALAGGRRARPRVIVFDRSALDLAVRMQVIYRPNPTVARRLVALLAPTPDIGFLLDIPPEVSLARKDDIWSSSQLAEQAELYRTLAPRFGAMRLDGQRPPDELAADIARATWLATS